MPKSVFSKRSLENIIVDVEDFITVKGIKALGNVLTEERIKQINRLEPLPYDEPVEEEENKDNEQPSLF